jgi:hypothetical protein
MIKQYKVSYKLGGKQVDKVVSHPKAIALTKLFGHQKGFTAMKAPALRSKISSQIAKPKPKKEYRGEGFGPITGPKGKPWYPETARAKPWKEKYTKLKESMPKSKVANAIRIQGKTAKILDREYKALEWQKKYLAKLLAKTPRTGKLSQTAITNKFKKISNQMKMNREVSSQVPSYNTAWNANLIRLILKRLPFLEQYESKYKKRFKD